MMNFLKVPLAFLLLGATGLFLPITPRAQEKQTGEMIFKQMKCGMCHGSKRQGTRLAPPLKEVGKWWSRDELLLYLKNPTEYIEKNERLKSMKKQYPKVSMPSFESIPSEQKDILVTFLLSQK